MKGQGNNGAGWFGVLVIVLGTIFVSKFWGPLAGPSGKDAAEAIMRQHEEDRKVKSNKPEFRYSNRIYPDFGK